MRPRLLAAVALVVLGGASCGDRDDGGSLVADAALASTTDLLVLRIPQGGGTARVLGYPRLDSVYWTGGRASATTRVIGFSPGAGTFVAAGKNGVPYRIDLRLGTIEPAGRIALKDVESADGSTIFGVASNGTIHRSTPQSAWTRKPRRPVRDLIPLVDGSLVIAGDERDRTRLVRIRPPDTTIVDTITVPRPSVFVRTAVGDRIYLAVGSAMIGIRTRGLERVSTIEMPRSIRTITPTPSGDRIYVIQDSSAVLTVVDRYRDEIVERIELPGMASEARMDPFGRYILVRPARGDSAWVVAVGSERLLGTVKSTWREDLPAVGLDGAVVAAQGRDVVILEPETLRTRRRINGGASDLWFLFAWSGFRPRAAGLDVPVDFGVEDTTAPDSAADPVVVESPDPDVTPAEPRPEPTPPARQETGGPVFIVSFAALLQEDAARRMAEGIRAGDQRARVVPSTLQGGTVYRVVLGPYATRADAERAAQSTGRQYWIYQGPP